MSKKLFFFFGLIVFLSNANAAQINYETASVGRVLGDSVGDVLGALDANSMDLKGARYFSHKLPQYDFSGVSDKPVNAIAGIDLVLQKEFGSDYKFFPPYWDWSDVGGEINSLNQKNSLVVLQSDAGFNGSSLELRGPFNLFSGTPKILAEQTFLHPGFQNSKPLFISDAPFTGLYLPKSFSQNRSLVSSYLSKSSGIIAPTGKSDPELLLSIVCSLFLKEERDLNEKILFGTLGDRYRNARNNFAEFGSGTDASLMSYQLFGLPFAQVDFKKFLGEEELKDYCSNFAQKNSLNATEFVSMEEVVTQSEANSFSKNVLIDFSDYSVQQLESGFSLIDFSGAIQEKNFSKPVLPFAVNETSFPLGTVISGAELVNKSNPIDLIVSDLPFWDNNSFVQRTCIDNNSGAEISFAPLFSEDKQIVVAKIFPVETIDCNTGVFRLWQNFEYKIDYSSFSDVLIDSHGAPLEIVPGGTVGLNAKLENITTSPVDGIVLVSDKPFNSTEWVGDLQPVKEPGFETTSFWSGDGSSSDFFSGKSSEWSSEGGFSWKFFQGEGFGDGFLSARQEVDFTNIESLSFDFHCAGVQSSPNYTEYLSLQVSIGNQWQFTQDFSNGCSSGNSGDIDVSGFEGIQRLEFRWVVDKAPHISSYIRSTGFVDNVKFVLENGGRKRDESTVFAQSDLELSAGNAKTVALDFSAPNEEGLYTFFVESDQNGDIKTQRSFDLKVELVSARLEVPRVVDSTADVKLLFNGNAGTPMDLIVNHYLLKGNEVIQKGTLEGTIASFEKELVFSYNGLLREDTAYTVFVEMLYDNRSKTLSESIISNHAPQLEFIAPIETTAGRTIELRPVASDIDGDDLLVTISEPFGSDGKWDTVPGDEGEYTALVSVSDGFLSVSQEIRIIVLPSAVACSAASDCGTDGVVVSNACFEDNVVDFYRAFECVNPGEISAFCSFTDSPIVTEECLNTCFEGSCIGEEDNYQFKKNLKITGLSDVSDSDTIEFLVDSSKWIEEGKLAPDCSNLKIFFNDSVEVDREVKNCGSTQTIVRFSLLNGQVINEGEESTDYSLYLGNKVSGKAKSDLSIVYSFYEDCEDTGGWEAISDALIGPVSSEGFFGSACRVSTHGSSSDSVFYPVSFPHKNGALEFSVKFGDEGFDWIVFLLGESIDTDYPSVGAMANQVFSESTFSQSPFDTQMFWSKNVWYDFSVELDSKNNCYEIFLGEQSVSNHCWSESDNSFEKLFFSETSGGSLKNIFYDEIKLFSRADAGVELFGEEVANTVPFVRIDYPDNGESMDWNSSIDFSVVDVNADNPLFASIFLSKEKGEFEESLAQNILIDSVLCPNFSGETSERFLCSFKPNLSSFEGKKWFVGVKVDDGFGEGFAFSDKNFLVKPVTGNDVLETFSDSATQKEIVFEAGFRCFDGDICPQKPWWDFDWKARQALKMQALGRIAQGEVIEFFLNTKNMIAQGKVKSDCSDLRVVFEHKTELERKVVNCNSLASKISFAAQKNHFNGTTDNESYSIYYSNPDSGAAQVLGSGVITSVQPKILLEEEKVSGENSFLVKKTFYLEFPKNAVIVDAKMDLAGASQRNYCFTDTFNSMNFIDTTKTNAQVNGMFAGGDPYFENYFNRTFLASSQENDSYGNFGFSNVNNVFISEPGVWRQLDISGWAQDSYYVNLEWYAGCSSGYVFTNRHTPPTPGGIQCQWDSWFVSRGADHCRIGPNANLSFLFNNFGTAISRGYMCGKLTGFGTYDPAYRVYLSQFAPESIIQSNSITSNRVVKATLNADLNVFGQNVNFFVSNDTGQTWFETLLGQEISLPAGTETNGLKWKAIMQSNNPVWSPRLHSVGLCYTQIGFPPQTEVGIGDGAKINWNSDEHIGSAQTVFLDSKQLQEFIKNNSSPESETVLVPIVFFAGETGQVNVSNLQARYFLHQNSAPKITFFSPQEGPVVNEGERLPFGVEVSDEENDNLTFSWFLDGELVEEREVYSFFADYFSSGTHSVRVVVSDGDLSVSKDWVLTIYDIFVECFSDRDCTDTDACTIDSCVRPGTPVSYCSHEPIVSDEDSRDVAAVRKKTSRNNC